MGFDGVWFGVALVIMIEIGQITPPMGLNLFAIHSISGKYKFSDVAKGALPYTALLGITIVLIYIFPELVLFLPEAMIGG
jgi:TRAP-type C4-dicarboxylate transport system permease large subunit